MRIGEFIHISWKSASNINIIQYLFVTLHQNAAIAIGNSSSMCPLLSESHEYSYTFINLSLHNDTRPRIRKPNSPQLRRHCGFDKKCLHKWLMTSETLIFNDDCLRLPPHIMREWHIHFCSSCLIYPNKFQQKNLLVYCSVMLQNGTSNPQPNWNKISYAQPFLKHFINRYINRIIHPRKLCCMCVRPPFVCQSRVIGAITHYLFKFEQEV